MNKLLSTPLALALSTAFVVSVNLSSCSSVSSQEQQTVEKNLSPEEAARKAAEKEKRRKEEEKRRVPQIPSGGCGH